MMDKIEITDLGNPPCNGCIICCRNDAIRIFDHEDASQWETEPHVMFPDRIMLKRKRNGDCIYLAETGCTIHGNAPIMCKEMDCRLIHRNVSYTKARKMAKRLLNFMQIWERGRKLYKETGRRRKRNEV
jgi:hypothetical protein